MSFMVYNPVSADESSHSSDQNVQNLKARINAIKVAENLEADEKKAILDLYSRAVENLEGAEKNRSRAKIYADLMAKAPADLKSLEQQISNLKSAPDSVQDLEGLSNQQRISSLEKSLLKLQTELLESRAKQADIRSKMLADEQNVLKLLEEATQQQSQAKDELNKNRTGDSVELANARNTFQLSEVEFTNSRVEMLRQRLLTRDTRAEVLDREDNLYTQKLNITNQKIKLVEDALSQVRKQVVDEKVEKARQREDQIKKATPDIQAVAEENANLANDLSFVVARTSELLSQSEQLSKELNRVERYFSSMSQQLSIAGAERLSTLSVDLLEQRKQFSKDLPQLINTNTLEKELTHAQINQLRLEDRQHDLITPEPPESSGLLKELLQEQLELLRDNVNAYRHYTSALINVHSENTQLGKRVEEYQELLNSRLFWIPSTTPVTFNSISNVNRDLLRLLGNKHWHEISKAVQNFNNPFSATLYFLLAFMLTALKSNLKRQLKHLGENVGKVNVDKLSSTFYALCITVLLALPTALFLMGSAELLEGGRGYAAHLRQGFTNAAILWVLLSVFFQICRKGGLAEVHFKWSPRIIALVRKHLPWLMAVMVTISVLMPIMNDAVEPYEAISRSLFIIASLALSLISHFIFKPSAEVLTDKLVKHPSQRRFLQYGVYGFTVGMPLILIVVSCLGYHFTALEILGRLLMTAWLLATFLVIYSLAIRGVALLERRMKLERIRAKRKAERALQVSRQAADDAAEGVPESLILQEVDMDAVSQQSRGFITLITAVLVAYALWNVWGNVTPALSAFDTMELWEVSTSDPNAPLRSVTVWDLTLGLLVVVLTYLGARNLPGALEISVLRGMDLGPGGSYAVITVVKYLIILLGTIAFLNLIGVQWSKLQWLVAAMGVGLGFGLQEILANFVSGLLILFERPIRVGDTVTVGEHTGTVTRIRIRATTLTDWDRKEQIIPNKTFITEQLTNWTLSDPITRQIIKVGVAYGSDVETVHKLLTKVISDNERVISDPPPAVFFVGFGDSSLDFELRVFVPGMLDLMPLVHELHVAINQTFKANNIEIPFPQRDVWVRSGGEDSAEPPEFIPSADAGGSGDKDAPSPA
ncbi:mechanosensitive ion channel [Aestuariicella hydrocarbonica]|uniref:Mechanosensitive ion channel n=2 Tax=Pseudomaricurvus hydrocarbonicus TaxID=1470433 RepID=A0A9E5JVJ6_9GAMM|nr:mechanosensitive ion channel [Aestuariicella hydrocarbonica]